MILLSISTETGAILSVMTVAGQTARPHQASRRRADKASLQTGPYGCQAQTQQQPDPRSRRMTGGWLTGEGHWHGRVDRVRQGLLGQGSGERRRPPHCDAAGPQQAAARLAANRSSRETTRFSIDLRPARNADFVQYCGVRPVWQPAGGSSRDPPHADTASVRKQLKRIDARVCGVWRFRPGSSSQCCRAKPRQQTWHTVCCSS